MLYIKINKKCSGSLFFVWKIIESKAFWLRLLENEHNSND